ncbi:MAG: rRNA maturation RNase YbeY [Flavobacteriales bacterium]|nr:rRNA maturation RNase YbeY [Flavobacteriales bacterium]
MSFHNESIHFTLHRKNAIKTWLEKVILKEKKSRGEIAFIFCDDEYLLTINRTYLKHDFYTDVITFDYCEEKTISGDVFISIDRVKDNAKSLNISFENELHRVMVHGVLHLLGYKDKTNTSSSAMRKMEDECLRLLES